MRPSITASQLCEADFYLALLSEGKEIAPGDGAYARQQLRGKMVVTEDRVENSVGIVFGAAVVPWGAITGLAVCSEAEGGTIVFRCEFQRKQVIGSSDRIWFPPGQFAVSELGA